jgi:SnoaL-like polyketide cyclase
MSSVQPETAGQRAVIMTVLTHLKNGEINEATACFAEQFQFNDWGIGLEFSNRKRLAEFFHKARELYPDSSLQTDRILVSGEYVIAQWILHTVVTERFYGGLSRKHPILLNEVSIVRIENEKIKDWSDYYDGLKSRRTALAGHFEEWVGL